MNDCVYCEADNDHTFCISREEMNKQLNENEAWYWEQVSAQEERLGL